VPLDRLVQISGPGLELYELRLQSCQQNIRSDRSSRQATLICHATGHTYIAIIGRVLVGPSRTPNIDFELSDGVAPPSASGGSALLRGQRLGPKF
jgi:hypothetical protein